jgi:hypothetical protein
LYMLDATHFDAFLPPERCPDGEMRSTISMRTDGVPSDPFDPETDMSYDDTPREVSIVGCEESLSGEFAVIPVCPVGGLTLWRERW